MAQPVSVTCPECGATLKLKSRSNLGKTRPCPNCEVPFVLSEEHNRDVYDLDARGARSRTDATPRREPPMLKRSASRGRRDPEGGPVRTGEPGNVPCSVARPRNELVCCLATVQPPRAVNLAEEEPGSQTTSKGNYPGDWSQMSVRPSCPRRQGWIDLLDG